VYKECKQYVIKCSGGCDSYYSRGQAEAHVCIENQGYKKLEEKYLECKSTMIKQDVEMRTL
jgi:hypothetical protein